MMTFPIIGDPQNIGTALNQLHRDNPKMKVIAMAAAPYLMANNPKIALASNPVPVHVLYMTVDSNPGDLVDAAGKPLAWQFGPNANIKN